MWFCITNIKKFDTSKYIKKEKIWDFVIDILLKEMQKEYNLWDKQFQELSLEIRNKYKEEKEIKLEYEFIWELNFYVYENKNTWKLYFEYICWNEIYNWNEEISYTKLLPVESMKIQNLVNKILEKSDKEQKTILETIKYWLYRFKNLILKEKNIEYINNTVVWSIDVLWNEWQWFNNKTKYINKRDIFLFFDIFTNILYKNKKLKDWLEKRKINIYLKRRILHSINWKVNYYKNEKFDKIIEENFWLLINMLKKIDFQFNIKELSFRKDGKLWLNEFIKILFVYEYINYWLICENCSALNVIFDAKNNIIKYKCRWCWKLNCKRC